MESRDLSQAAEEGESRGIPASLPNMRRIQYTISDLKMEGVIEQGTGPFRPQATRNRILPITSMSSEADTSSELDKSLASQHLDSSLEQKPKHTIPGLVSCRTET